ncbi:hypothetical protein TCAL_12085 [Tigriopus californicus]|uniref:Methyltransferase domain-containing protein n=1 Tax=Tigriopus californicus TaxID=6832 RepID=A0A553NR43_TIGCA|nr:EEF1A lysine methyltransferase 4-like [Tigriopus californicus]TRY67896.1 hypothetical protein TCAL_12085 [Tigriopus californicus]|eukprot:TCALIF_12085-PA protein Name:"Similar to ECE2 Endothelin-converting enzyme 2 (Bos taurus)" AED:0.02 eAED:0.04 QI:0/-1/0/1/-1/1/1/0/252
MSDNAKKYSDVNYWNKRYESEDHFEWLGVGHEPLLDEMEHILSSFPRDTPVLILGCGNSRLSVDLLHRGFTDILSTDYSRICIQNQRAQFAHEPGLKWDVMDMTRIPLPDQSFSIVIEKATIDGFLAHEPSPWRVGVEAKELLDASLREISRILKPHGRFLSVTFRQPHFRLPLMARMDLKWNVSFHEVLSPNSFHFYIYQMTKDQPLDLSGLEHFLRLGDASQNDNDYQRVASSDSEDEDFVMSISSNILT